MIFYKYYKKNLFEFLEASLIGKKERKNKREMADSGRNAAYISRYKGAKHKGR